MSGALKKILFVEDEADIREMAQMSLETLGGYEVSSCAGGEEALKLAESGQQSDLLLLDVMMPGMDGPTTLKALRALPEFERIPAVFMTAKAQPEEIAGLLALGAAAVIPKPFDPMTLPERLADIWAAHRQ